MSYEDRPCIVAAYGVLLVEAGINIAALQIARDDKQSIALSVLTVDSPVSDELADSLRDAVGTPQVHVIDIIEDL
ncbi:MAG: phosphoglycerate dehydrogenase, partial [Microbacteriaceae bacterium]